MPLPERNAGGLLLRGIAASPGIAIARAWKLRRQALVVPEESIAEEAVESEIERLRGAIALSTRQLQAIRTEGVGHDIVGAILQTQIMILEDRQLFEDAVRAIREQRRNAAHAVSEALAGLMHLIEAVRDDYLRERRADVGFAGRRLLQNLLGREPETLAQLRGPAVVVADDLSPGEAAQLDPERVVGLVTDAGGRTSHTAIMASSLQIPAVVGLEALSPRVRDGDLLVVDGYGGRVVVRPDEAAVASWRDRARAFAVQERELLSLAHLPAETRDGHRVELRANIERSAEIPTTRTYGARGVGLFRTEFLFMNRPDLPDEEEQFRHYREVLEGAAPDPVVIRTLDLGGDKLGARRSGRSEANPALGLRGIRLSLADRAIFCTQVRAMLRASVHGRLRILLPLVTGVEEVRAAREFVEEMRGTLDREGHPLGAEIRIGAMIETPAAVSLAELLAREVDFFSIGTNDLVQYTVAVDRANEHVAYLYSPLHPAVLRAIRGTVSGAHCSGKPVAVCGEMAGDPLHGIVLVGLGVDELSMTPAAIPHVKRILRDTSYGQARAFAAELLELATETEIADRVRKEMLRRFPEEFEAP